MRATEATGDSSAGAAGAPTAMWIIPHTHWDREWYEPHDIFRARLVRMIDGLLDLLEREGDYRFTLDGQAAAFEDYLAIRPESAGRLRAAVARGQLGIGPFLSLLDEFCCDGETTVRNLELGIRSCRAVGTEMRVGYLPDMFGHAAQMPQVLRGFGLADAALWRGAPAGGVLPELLETERDSPGDVEVGAVHGLDVEMGLRRVAGVAAAADGGAGFRLSGRRGGRRPSIAGSSGNALPRRLRRGR